MSSTLTERLSSFIDARLNRRSLAFLACLALATLFWLLTSLSQEYSDEIKIPIVYQGLPDDLLLVNDPPHVSTVEVQGFGFRLLLYKLGLESIEIPVVTDPEELPHITLKGEPLHYVILSRSSDAMRELELGLLDVLQISPDTLFLQFKPKFTKRVAVKLLADISFGKQFGMAKEPELIPDSVTIVGTRKELDTIQFVFTEMQIWKDLDESLTAKVDLRSLGNSSHLSQSHSSVQVEINVVEFTEGSVNVPINIVTSSTEAVNVFPSVVELKYLVPLTQYDQVTADQFQVSVTLDAASSKRPRLTVNIDRHPDFVSQLRVNPPEVEFIIQK